MSNEKRRLVLIVLLHVRLGLASSRTLGPAAHASRRSPRGRSAKAADQPSKPRRRSRGAEKASRPRRRRSPPRTAGQAGQGREEPGRRSSSSTPASWSWARPPTSRPTGYRLEVQLEQKGAGVESLLSSRYDAEFEGRDKPHRPLQLIRRDPVWPPSLSLTLSTDPMAQSAPRPQPSRPGGRRRRGRACQAARESRGPGSTRCSGRSSATSQGRVVRPLTAEDPATASDGRGPGGRLPDDGRQRRGRDQDLPALAGRGTASRSSSGSRAPTRSGPSRTTCSARTASRSRASGTPAPSATSSSAPLNRGSDRGRAPTRPTTSPRPTRQADRQHRRCRSGSPGSRTSTSPPSSTP